MMCGDCTICPDCGYCETSEAHEKSHAPVADTPDDALIEAMTRALGCRVGSADNKCAEGCSYCDGSECWEHGEAFDANGHCAFASTVAAALVEHLELTEETRDLCECGGQGSGHFMADAHGPRVSERRLVSKWVEVQP